MKTLLESIKNPSGLDSMSNYMGQLPDPKWLVVMTRSRDSDVLTESNWHCALDRLGGESESVEVFRFGHWACGWWEALCVSGDKVKQGKEIEKKIDCYLILDENDFSEREQDEATRVWQDCYDKKDRLRYIREHKNQFDFINFKELMCNIRGEYFSGYASELIG